MEQINIPIWHKQNLTIEEAAEYSNIGQTKLREMTGEITCPFALHIGRKVLIKRELFDDYIKNIKSI